MTPTNRSNNRRGAGVKPAAAPTHTMSLQDFDELAAAQALQVEHQTIPGFLRRIPHKWHLNEIARFGSEVGRAAEAMQLVYMTAVDRSLGVLRVFPLPLLERVYTLMSPQFGWPALLDAAQLGDVNRVRSEALRKTERTDQLLQELTERADDVNLLTSANAVREFLRGEMEKLKEELPA